MGRSSNVMFAEPPFRSGAALEAKVRGTEGRSWVGVFPIRQLDIVSRFADAIDAWWQERGGSGPVEFIELRCSPPTRLSLAGEYYHGPHTLVKITWRAHKPSEQLVMRVGSNFPGSYDWCGVKLTLSGPRIEGVEDSHEFQDEIWRNYLGTNLQQRLSHVMPGVVAVACQNDVFEG